MGGRAYFLADAGDRTLRSFLGDLAAARGVRLPDRSVPGWLARAAAAALDAGWRAIGRTTAPPLIPFEVAMMSRSVTVRTGRAERELGWRPVRTVGEGLASLRAG